LDPPRRWAGEGKSRGQGERQSSSEGMAPCAQLRDDTWRKKKKIESGSIRGGIGFPPPTLRQDLGGFRRRGGSGDLYEGKLDSVESEYEGGEREEAGLGHSGLGSCLSLPVADRFPSQTRMTLTSGVVCYGVVTIPVTCSWRSFSRHHLVFRT
jgi:hypothetical protein